MRYIIAFATLLLFACKKCDNCTGTDSAGITYDMGEKCGKELKELNGSTQTNSTFIDSTGAVTQRDYTVSCRQG